MNEYTFETRPVFPQALTYRGDVTGMVGAILGPSLDGRIYRVEAAEFDGEKTRVAVSLANPAGGGQ